jgi:hypothetical protein
MTPTDMGQDSRGGTLLYSTGRWGGRQAGHSCGPHTTTYYSRPPSCYYSQSLLSLLQSSLPLSAHTLTPVARNESASEAGGVARSPCSASPHGRMVLIDRVYHYTLTTPSPLESGYNRLLLMAARALNDVAPICFTGTDTDTRAHACLQARLEVQTLRLFSTCRHSRRRVQSPSCTTNPKQQQNATAQLSMVSRRSVRGGLRGQMSIQAN